MVPKGFRLELVPTMRNYDQEFIETWYEKLKSFSLTLTKNISSYCDKTIVQTKQIKHLRNIDWFGKCYSKIIRTNDAKTKHFLHQHTFKTFNSLESKSETTREKTLQASKMPTTFKKSYANAVSGAKDVKHNNHIISCNTSNTNVANEWQTILGNYSKDRAKHHPEVIQKLNRHLPQQTEQLKKWTNWTTQKRNKKTIALKKTLQVTLKMQKQHTGQKHI